MIKCFGLAKAEQPIHALGAALNEYCIMRIADALGVGPELTKKSCFDIIAYPNCV